MPKKCDNSDPFCFVVPRSKTGNEVITDTCKQKNNYNPLVALKEVVEQWTPKSPDVEGEVSPEDPIKESNEV